MPSSDRRALLYRPATRFLLRTAARPFALPNPEAIDAEGRAAIALASPDLAEALRRAPGASPPPGARRYLRRMATRATPFGLFASVAVGRWGAGAPPALVRPIDRAAVATDGAWAAELIATIEADPQLREALAWYWHGGDPHDAALSFPAEPREVETLRAVAARARDGGTIAELSGVAGRDVVERLIAERRLVSELFFPFRGDALAGLIAAAERHDHPLAAPLREIAGGLRRLEEGSCTAEAIDALTARMRALAPGHAGPTLRADAAAALSPGRLPEEVAAAAAEAAELLLRLTPYVDGALDFRRYEARFAARHGDVEVPLLDLIDPVRGLGMPDPAVPGHGAERDRALLALAAEALASGAVEMELDDARLATLAPDYIGRNALPRSTEIKCQIDAAGPEALARGEWRLVLPTDQVGWPAGRVVGRFAGLLGREAGAMLDEIADAELEWDSGVAAVELLFAPGERGHLNPCCRGVGRGFAIALDTAPDVPARRRVWLEDVVVGLRKDGFYFRWTAGEVELRASAWCAYNPLLMPAPLRFMLLAQAARRRVLASFAWGSAAMLPRTPRLVRGRIVLAPACWTIDPAIASDPAGFDAALAAWRERWQVPDLVQIGTGDRRLLLDLSSAEDRAELARRLAGEGGPLRLVECLPGPGRHWLQGPGGDHVSELVVPLLLEGARRLPKPRHAVARRARAAEERRLGSDWLPVHVEAPLDRHAALVAGPLRELAEGLMADGVARGWTYVRYQLDEGPHVRFRLHGDPATLRERALPRIDEALGDLIDRGAISGFDYRTYRREIGRYGGERAMPHVEALFAADSRWCAALLHAAGHAPHRPGPEALAAWSLEVLLEGLGLDPASWPRMPGFSDGGDSVTGDLLRRDKAFLLDRARDWRLGLDRDGYVAAVAERARALRDLEGQGAATRSLGDMATHIAHMHCNRLLGIDRQAELRARQLLVRVLRSRAARSRAKVTA